MQEPAVKPDHMRFHAQHAHMAAPFGEDKFGQLAETFAHFFGTPRFIISQTVLVIAWIAVNAAVVAFRWDPYPFILLNLAFSTQAAYAAPLILLAETRQAERDKVWSEADARHREEIAQTNLTLLQQNTDLTREVAELTRKVTALTEEIHSRILAAG
ncbi:MAG TPA: DUF1003 domain-containing protein [Dehalococcoidia bacterium]|nr:DUF1003 domain-containing protein [Dehalococcoidia bacterium]